ncbi:MAG TPA: hypothetical protein VG454_10170 [Gemmatimonadales bacterium]|nr:hypothetical protein [Gemmatimonadales bacterium]
MATKVVASTDRPSAATLLADPGDFSVVLGGPLFQLFRKAHLAGAGLELQVQRIIAVTVLSWLPLLLLSAAQGLALGPKVAVPFLQDIETQARFLLFVPLLVGAESIVHQRLRFVARQFLDRELIPEAAEARFRAAIDSTIRLRNSVLAEVIMIAVVYIVGVQVVWRQTALDVATWYATPGPEGNRLSLAGLWYLYFSLPLTQFLLLRWYYRLFIWTRFLWQTSRIDLALVPTHPDHTGGLGFLTLATSGFAPLAVAHGAFVSAWIASRIFQHQGGLLDFKFVIGAIAVWVLLLFLAPFLVFSPQLARKRREGERDYGPFAQRYSHEFDAKWVHPERPGDEPLLGTADIQSLADLANVYAIVRTMRTTPITKQTILALLIPTLAPIAPLALTMMPLGQLVKLLFGMLK